MVNFIRLSGVSQVGYDRLQKLRPISVLALALAVVISLGKNFM